MDYTQPSYNTEDLDPVPPYPALSVSPPPYEYASLEATNGGVPGLNTSAQTTVPAQPVTQAQIYPRTDGGAYARVRNALRKVKSWMKAKFRRLNVSYD
ncbi:hypothetical protein B0H12DRAFT_1230781 [Mycena haematopus]|nr:hypothetical protein B0H12DRAFT_1230781 [Mycena haematopus]